MQVGKVIPAADGSLFWLLDRLPLAVRWDGPGSGLWLVSYPWPGDDAGVVTPVATLMYRDRDMADKAARLYIGGLNWQ